MTNQTINRQCINKQDINCAMMVMKITDIYEKYNRLAAENGIAVKALPSFDNTNSLNKDLLRRIYTEITNAYVKLFMHLHTVSNQEDDDAEEDDDIEGEPDL